MAKIEEKKLQALQALPTIEDRAKYIFANTEKQGVTNGWGNQAWQFSEYGALYAIEGAMKIQDRIARAEERERCIQRAQLRECKRCKDNDKCWLCYDCTIMQDVRKAMEGGEG